MMTNTEIRCSDAGQGIFATGDIHQGATVFDLTDSPMSLIGAIAHSCKANCVVRNGRIVAWECIPVGTEITINFRMTETHLVNPFTCACCSEEK